METKTKLEEKKIRQAADMLKAIAHPMRIEIVSLLEEGRKMTVTEIHEHLNLEQSATSHHLSILRDKGILNAEREGKNIFYSLKHARLSQIISCIEKCQNEL